MSNDSQQSLPDFQPVNPPVESPEIQPQTPPVFSGAVPYPPAAPKKSNKTLWIVVGVVLGVLASCCLVIVGAIVFAGINSVKEKAPIESVLDSFMKSMLAKDAESAFALFSPRAQRQTALSKIQEQLEGNNYLLFEGYRSLSISNINISAAANTDPDKPQGTVAKVEGTISYEGGIKGTFNGTLEKVNGEWRIHGFFVNVPPSKFK